MKQTSFAQAEFAAKKKITRRERFLAEMEQAVLWSRVNHDLISASLASF
jgi:IS5 family transposase